MKPKCFCLSIVVGILFAVACVNAQWQFVGPSPYGAVFEMATSGGTLYAGGYDDVLTQLLRRSTDNGLTWSVAASGIRFLPDSLWPGVHNMVSRGSTLFLASSRWIYKLEDNQLPWQTISDTTVILHGASFVAESESVIVALTENLVLRTSNQGLDWDTIGATSAIGLTRVFARQGVLLAGRSFYLTDGIYYSSNFGKDWQLNESGLPDSIFVFAIGSVGESMFVAGSDNTFTDRPTAFVARSTDGGLNWVTRRTGLPNPSGVSSLTYFENTLFAGTGTLAWGGCGVYRSMDFGETWENVSANLPSQFPFVIASLCVNNGYLFAGTEGAGVYRRPLSEILPIQLASFTGHHLGGTHVRLDWRTFSETNNFGFYVERRRVSDTTFTQISQLIPGYGTTNEPHDYSFVDSNATINRWYYRLKQVDLSGPVHYVEPILVDVTTGISEQQTPHEFRLEQNYPNPFNPQTTIKFELSEKTHVKLEVFDILGRSVAVIVNEVRDVGSYSVQFEGGNLSSGVYLYRLTAGSRVTTQKMLLTR